MQQEVSPNLLNETQRELEFQDLSDQIKHREPIKLDSKPSLNERARALAEKLRNNAKTRAGETQPSPEEVPKIVYSAELAAAAKELFNPENFAHPSEHLIKSTVMRFALIMANEFLSQFPGQFDEAQSKKVRGLFMNASLQQAEYAQIQDVEGSPKVTIKAKPDEQIRNTETIIAQHTGYIASQFAEATGWDYQQLNAALLKGKLLFPSEGITTKQAIIDHLATELEKNPVFTNVKERFEAKFLPGENNWAVYATFDDLKLNLKNTPYAGEASVVFDQDILRYNNDEIRDLMLRSNDELFNIMQPQHPVMRERQSVLFKALMAKNLWTDQMLIDSLASGRAGDKLFKDEHKLLLSTFFGMIHDVMAAKGKPAAEIEAKKDINQIRDYMRTVFGWQDMEEASTIAA